MYNILFTKSASKEFSKLPKGAKLRIKSKLIDYKLDPLRYAKRLSDSKIGTFRFRIGDYRAIFDLDETNVYILKIGHRKDIYK